MGLNASSALIPRPSDTNSRDFFCHEPICLPIADLVSNYYRSVSFKINYGLFYPRFLSRPIFRSMSSESKNEYSNSFRSAFYTRSTTRTRDRVFIDNLCSFHANFACCRTHKDELVSLARNRTDEPRLCKGKTLSR
jgi:hypothetical protein